MNDLKITKDYSWTSGVAIDIIDDKNNELRLLRDGYNDALIKYDMQKVKLLRLELLIDTLIQSATLDSSTDMFSVTDEAFTEFLKSVKGDDWIESYIDTQKKFLS